MLLTKIKGSIKKFNYFRFFEVPYLYEKWSYRKLKKKYFQASGLYTFCSIPDISLTHGRRKNFKKWKWSWIIRLSRPYDRLIENPSPWRPRKKNKCLEIFFFVVLFQIALKPWPSKIFAPWIRKVEPWIFKMISSNFRHYHSSHRYGPSKNLKKFGFFLAPLVFVRSVLLIWLNAQTKKDDLELVAFSLLSSIVWTFDAINWWPKQIEYTQYDLLVILK